MQLFKWFIVALTVFKMFLFAVCDHCCSHIRGKECNSLFYSSQLLELMLQLNSSSLYVYPGNKVSCVIVNN